MRTLKRLGTGVLALGVAAAGMLMTAPMASAHNTTLNATSQCQEDGTYLVTYTGSTTLTGGRTADLTVSQVTPDGTTVADAPAHVVGNTTYSFTQIVPGTATRASVQVDLFWPSDHASAHASAAVTLAGDCQPPVTPVTPSGNLRKDCVDGGGHVWAGRLDNGTVEHVSWRLVSGTRNSHDNVVAGPRSGKPLEANGLPDATRVWLQFSLDEVHWVDEGSVVRTGHCAPVVKPTGSYTVVCSETGADVTIGALSSGTLQNVVWTLAYGSQTTTVASGDVVAVPALAWLKLTYSASGRHSHKVQSGRAPEACPPTGDRSLDIVKSVSPTGDAEFGDTLTYTLQVTAGGSLGQTDVVVTDYIPGYKPGRESGLTSYVPGSASCDAGTCTTAYDDAAKLVTWRLGDMAAGASRTVSFAVVIDTPNTLAEAIPAETIFNSAAVESTEIPTTPSNEVATPVTAVLAEHHSNPPPKQHDNQPTAVLGVSLAHTGAPAHLPWTLGFAALFLLLGSALIFLGRRPEAPPVPGSVLH